MNVPLTAAELLDRHLGIELLSLDFFDTLVTRAVAQPTHVFAVVEEQLVRDHGRRWRGLALQRVRAEARAREVAAGDDAFRDITFEEILEQLAAAVSLDAAEVELVGDLERRTEQDLARAVPFGRDLLEEARSRGVPVVVVSDNYMPAGQLLAMAHAAGLDALEIDHIFVSSEHDGMKHNGRLFRDLLDAVKIPPRRILHVGDDLVADVEQPSRLGMATHRDARLRVTHRHMENTSPAVLALSRIEAHLRDGMRDTGWDTVRAMGAGPVAVLVAAQIADVLSVSATKKVDGVYFASRDGWLAHQVWERCAPLHAGTPGRYLQFSRSVFGRASITAVDEHVARRFIDDHERLTVAQLESRFGCSFGGGLSADEVMDAAAARELLTANSEAVVGASRALRDRVVGHLRSTGILEPGHHLVVDLGWTGASVADLADLVRAESNGASTIEGRFLGLYWRATPQRTRLAMGAVAMDDIGPLADNVRLLGAIRYFETLMTAPHGSVVDFEGPEGGFAPVHAVNDVEEAQYRAILAPLAEAAIDSAAQIVAGVHPSGVSIGDLGRGAAWATMMQAAHTPRGDELAVMSRLRHVASLDHRDTGVPVVAPPPRHSSTLPFDWHGDIYDRTIRRHWLQGSVRSWRRASKSRLFADQMVATWPLLRECWMDDPA